MINDEMAKAAATYIVPNGNRPPLAIFPLHTIVNGICTCKAKDKCNAPGKHPHIEENLILATTDPAQIAKWWRMWPGSNIGIVTGTTNGLVVIDVDNHDGTDAGAESLCALQKQYGVLPDTWEVITGSGGRHLYYKYPQGYTIKSSKKKIAPSIDIRADGGYVVAPPSTHISGGRYEWEASSCPNEIPLADLPQAWIVALSKLTTGESSSKPPMTLPETIPQGERNDTLFRHAASLRARKTPASKILNSLIEINRTRCKPPCDDAEVHKIYDQVMKYSDGQPEKDIIAARDKVAAKMAEDARKATLAANRNAALNAANKMLAESIEALKAEFPGDGIEAQKHERLDIDTTQVRTIYDYDYVYHRVQRYNSSFSWVAWDGSIWQRNADAIALKRYFRLTDLHKTATMYLSGDELLAKYANKMRTTKYGEGVLTGTRGYMAKTATEFDINPADLNTPGGIVDLRTGVLRPFDARAYCTHVTTCTPGTQGADEWSDFLQWFSCGDTALQRYIQQIAGMAAYGKLMYEGIIIMYGGGSNGKSTLFNAIQSVLGIGATGYAGSISPDILMTTREGNDRATALSAIFGKRLVIAAETEEGNRLDGSVVKRLASTDQIHARYLYHDGFDFTPTHTLILYTNHLPRVGSADDGMWRRIIAVPCNAKRTPGAVILNYGAYLAEHCGPAILQWIIDGAVQFIANGYKLDEPQCVRDFTAEYRGEQNTIQNFLDECCTIDSAADRAQRKYSRYALASELQTRYQEWAESNGEWSGRKSQELAAALRSMDFSREKRKTGRVWMGLELNPKNVYSYKVNYQ